MAEYIAKTLFGFEKILADELQEIGASGIKLLSRAVSFEGDKKVLYLANFKLRTALKILVPLTEAEIGNEQQLYDFIRTIRWDRFMGVNDTLAVDVSMNTGLFSHSQYIAQKIKDAVVDQFRDKFGSRPSVDLDNPVLRINAHISDRNIKIARDSSGDSLHRRGYRVKQGPAPLNEVLAAGLVRLSGWKKNTPLVDFMCGSGTIAIEAAMMAADIWPGDIRAEYGFRKWKDYDPNIFNAIVNEKKRELKNNEISIEASDISADAVRLAIRHSQNAGVFKYIRFNTMHLADVVPPDAPGTVILNPPYGERIVQQNLNDLYKTIGDKLKKDFSGFDAWILSSNAEAMKNVGLHPSPRIQVYNGQLECRFNHYSLYQGSKKAPKTSDS